MLGDLIRIVLLGAVGLYLANVLVALVVGKAGRP